MIPYFDAHCDTPVAVAFGGGTLLENPHHLDLRRLALYAPCAQVFSVCVYHGENMVPETERVLDHLLGQLEEYGGNALLCRSAADIDDAAKQGKIAALLSIEGCERFGCSLEALERLFQKGVRIVHLTWNHDNALSGAAMDGGGGLTAAGRAFVPAAQSMGVALDLSHISERGFWDVLECARRPVLAGHSNAFALCPHPRNLTDGQFTALLNRGGVAGLNLHRPFLGLGEDVAAVVAHAEHWLSLGGERAVCLGCDLDGIPALPEGMTGVESLGALYEAMLRRNWSEDLVRDIFYRNLRDFFRSAL